jgi:hypothetical protein
MWDIARAVTFFRWFEPTCSSYGFRAAVFGSVMRDGVGNDLDIVIFPRRHIRQDLGGLLRVMAGVAVSVTPGGADESADFSLYEFSLNGGYRLHVSVRSA